MKRFRPTLRNVAERAGVSLATASNALNARPGVAEETRASVLQAAEAISYRPNRAARAIAGGSLRQLGAVLSPTVQEPGSPNYYVAELLVGAEAEARKRGYQLQVAMWDRGVPWICDGSVDGLLFLGGSFPPEAMAGFDVPTVLVGTVAPAGGFDSVMADNRLGAYLAVAHLLATGRRRIAFINGPATTRSSQAKLAGYREALMERRQEAAPEVIVAGDFTVTSGERAAADLFASRPGPDALFVADDPMAAGALRMLLRLGISVPGDVSVVGFGDSPVGELLTPSLSTVRVFQQRMGALAAKRLVERLTEPVLERVRMLITPELVIRESSDLAHDSTAAA